MFDVTHYTNKQSQIKAQVIFMVSVYRMIGFSDRNDKRDGFELFSHETNYVPKPSQPLNIFIQFLLKHKFMRSPMFVCFFARLFVSFLLLLV